MAYSLSKTLLVGLIGGAVASWVKAKVEPPLQKLGEEKFPPRPGKKSLAGADVTNQPENMPPAILADDVYQLATGKELTKEEKIKSLPFIHYGMGMAIGVTYTMIVNKHKDLALDGGVLAGAAIWSTTHGSLLPFLGLQGQVDEMPKSWWVWEFGSHLVFGLAMEQSRRILNKVI